MARLGIINTGVTAVNHPILSADLAKDPFVQKDSPIQMRGNGFAKQLKQENGYSQAFGRKCLMQRQQQLSALVHFQPYSFKPFPFERSVNGK